MKSRYIHTSRHRLPRHKQSKRIYGSFEDSNKWVKCHWCGFIVNLQRAVTSTDGSGTYNTDYPVASTLPIANVNEIQMNICSLSTTSNEYKEFTIIQLGVSDYYTPRKPMVNGGCPNCGTKNLP